MTVWDAGDPAVIADRLRAEFAARYGAAPDCVGRAPGRVNLIGEHTDYNAGLVLPIALPHATYAALRLRTDGVLRVASSQIEEPWTGTTADLGTTGMPAWVGYAVGVLTTLGDALPEGTGVDVVLDSTVPMGAGLSSSAAIECAVGVAALTAAGLPWDDAGRDLLTAAAIRAETEVVGAPTGGMDQTISVHGVAGEALLIDFRSGRRVGVPADVDGHAWLVTDTRVSHALTDGGYGSRRADCERAAAALGVPTLREADLDAVEALTDDLARRRARHVVSEIARTRLAADALRTGDLADLGARMAASHLSMRDDFEISCAELDTAVAAATDAGAVGARMTGGGFGGSSVALVPRERVDAVIGAIDAAFAGAGFAAPRHLLAPPSAGAGVVGGPAAG